MIEKYHVTWTTAFVIYAFMLHQGSASSNGGKLVIATSECLDVNVLLWFI